ncbi:hypothetical protein [Haloarchaeobius sp. DYHT-AS-18]|uniref:hypothetical protein n=1 Tax=Haloarchaeobius sp. DYHT-AS-18 TaxID=3446117 RepID=UPI003EBFCDDB
MVVMDSDGSARTGTRLRDKEGELKDETGSADLEVRLDKSTARAEEVLTGMGSGGANGGFNSTEGVEREDSFQVTSISSDSSTSTVKKTEQALEDATGGRAFGSTREKEDIGSGAAVTDTTPQAPAPAAPMFDGLPVDNLLVGALAVIALVFVVGGGLNG